MIPKNNPIHPGEILREEYLAPLALQQTKFAAMLGVPVQRVNELCTGKRGITPETAWLLSAALATSPEFWMNLQAMYDLSRAQEMVEHKVEELRLQHRRTLLRALPPTVKAPTKAKRAGN